jgi:PIN domain nuclease of toxin-antitoxin system
MILLDTHIWLWWLVGDGALSLSERTSLDNHADRGQIAISWVSIWEAEMHLATYDSKIRAANIPDLQIWKP